MTNNGGYKKTARTQICIIVQSEVELFTNQYQVFSGSAAKRDIKS